MMSAGGTEESAEELGPAEEPGAVEAAGPAVELRLAAPLGPGEPTAPAAGPEPHAATSVTSRTTAIELPRRASASESR